MSVRSRGTSILNLSPEQKTELEKFRRQASSKDSEKALMVLLSADGRSVRDISATLKRNPHTVRDWLKPKVYGFSAIGGIDKLIERFRKYVWHYNNCRLANPIKFNLETYAGIL